jgi:predicted phosphoribosyltransferase
MVKEYRLPYPNRSVAGRVLGAQLLTYADRPRTVIMALPRGGVPVAAEVARMLRVPWDVFIVRKVGVPGYEELAMGAIASGGVRVMNDEILSHLSLPDTAIARAVSRAADVIHEREHAYRGDRPGLDVRGHTVILIDDGLATDATMRAAVRALRAQGAGRLVVAVPVAAPDVCDALRPEVDEVVCAATPDPFGAVGFWYEDFSQTSDDEVRALLADGHEDTHTRARAG